MSYFLILISSFLVYLIKDLFIISELYFYILLIIILLDYNVQKSITLFQVWQLGFIFIILSEALLKNSYDSYFLEASRYLIMSNNILIIGYKSFKNIKLKKQDVDSIYMNTKKTIRNKNPLLFLLIITFVIAYITYQLPRNLIVFNYGRSTAYSMDLGTNIIFLSSIISSIPLILPSIIAFYFKEIKKLDSLFKPILLSLPIFIVQFVGGTRFPLLFSMGGFFIIIFANKLNGRIRLNYKIITIGIVLLLITEIMTSVRVKGLGSEQLELIKKNETRISKVLASNMSPEGVINMTSLMMNHFDNNPHMYGKSTSFIFYFWIPRSIWPDKPTMLGNWLIRKYQDGFSSVHSASFGFTGDLYADFGYYSLFLIFILGIILRRLDIFFSLTLSKSGSYSKVFAAMLFPYTFFFVRSPITSTITFLGILLIYLLFRKIIFLKFK